jgi:hypothetical protein
MYSENIALYNIARLAAQFVELIDADGHWPERPKPRDFDRLATRLQRLLSDAEAVLNPQYSPPATRAERHETRKRKTFAKALDTFASAVANAATVQPKFQSVSPVVSAPPEPALRPVFANPEWLISLNTFDVVCRPPEALGSPSVARYRE